MSIYLGVVLTYLVFLTGVSVYASRVATTSADFLVAGRKLSAPVLVGTLLATWIGSGSIIAGAGLAYREGFAALWFDAGVWVALGVIYFIAGRARRLEQLTVPDVLELRYNPWARVLGTLVTIIAYTVIASYQFRAGGLVLNVVTGLNPAVGTLITFLFVTTFTATAGLLSIAYTDIFNGLLMLGGIFFAYPFLIARAGGWEGVRERLVLHFGEIGAAERLSLMGRFTLTEALSYALPTLLLMLGLANMYQRFFSARDERTARRAVVGWILGTVAIETMIVVLAVIGSSLFPELASGRSEQVLLYAAREGLPVVAGCVLLAAAVAIIASTGDSFLLVPATSLVRDIYHRFVNPQATERQLILASRVAVVALGVLGYILIQFFETVLRAALFSYTMYGVGVTPALLACFLWKRVTTAGGIASILGGMLTTLTWHFASLAEKTGIETIYPALAASLIGLIGGSLLTPPPPEEKWRPFFS
jgi:SSS family solute:Na+ symporter